MEQFLTSVTEVVAASLLWMNQYLSAILDNPALLTICIALPLVSVSVDLIRRLIRL